MRLTAHEIRVRRRARARALQALYAWDLIPDGGLVRVGEKLFADLAVGPDERTVAAPLLARVPWFRSKLPAELLRGGGVPYGFVLGLGAVVGELPNSFVKRQLGIAPGSRKWTVPGVALVVFDQADFVPVTWLLLRPLWRMPLRDMLIAFALVTAIHLGINVAGYAIGARESPI